MKSDRLSFDTEIKHSWKKGEWKRELGDDYQTRTDTCKLCGMERTSMRFFKNGKLFTYITSYKRSKIIYDAKQVPPCWGDKNPK